MKGAPGIWIASWPEPAKRPSDEARWGSEVAIGRSGPQGGIEALQVRIEQASGDDYGTAAQSSTAPAELQTQ